MQHHGLDVLAGRLLQDEPPGVIGRNVGVPHNDVDGRGEPHAGHHAGKGGIPVC